MNNELRAKFEAWFSEGSGEHLDWMDHVEAYNDYTHDAMWQAYQAAHASRDAEVEALKRDAERYVAAFVKLRKMCAPHLSHQEDLMIRTIDAAIAKELQK